MREERQKGEPFFPYCVSCTIKHILLAEGHMGEAIDRCAREHNKESILLIRDSGKTTYPKSEWMDKMRDYANILNGLAELRKELEKIYFSEEILVAKMKSEGV